MASSRIHKIIEHAKKFGFLNNDLKRSVNDYGPFGSQMRKNLLDVWWKYSVTLQDNIFPLYVADIDRASTIDVNGQSNLPFRNRAENNYESFAKNISSSELGIAQITSLPAVDNTAPYSSLFMRTSSFEYLTVHHFCHSKRGSALFNDVIKSRLRWWKRFSNRQANFNHQVKESKTDGLLAVAEIIHDCSFGKSSVERISHKILNQNENTKNVIECCTNIEQALSAFLDDGFEERVLDEENKSLQVLRLHPKIAPINVVILAEDTTNEEQADLVDRLSKELKVVGITCHKLSLRDESEVYDFADAIGTPFSLKIDDMTLKRGIIGLRHRDTTVHEFMHISGVTETLTKVLYS